MIEIIDGIVEDILDSIGVISSVLDIQEFVKEINGSIEYIDNKAIDNKIIKNGTDGFIILLNRERSVQHERFTIAHELGHLFLHMGYLLDNNKWLRTNPQKVYLQDIFASERDYQANLFAYSLLMPKYQFLRIINQYLCDNKVSIKKIATYFNVELEAVIKRGQYLKIF